MVRACHRPVACGPCRWSVGQHFRSSRLTPANIVITSVWGLPFGECTTSSPVNFDLNYTGPVSGLGAGLTFTGTTSFPTIKGCVISAIMTAFMSGAGQVYTFNVAPPAPVAN